jgi:hypothetical protein
MKNNYLYLTIIGTILPNIFVLKESLSSGNYLLYADPIATFNGMFANNISGAFIVDLLFIVMLFLFWSYKESKKHNIKNLTWVWIYTFAFGIAGGLPLFLYIREKRKEVIATDIG